VTRKLEDTINYHFRDESLLLTAISHSSFVNEQGSSTESNERLEFLGDAVLSVCVADMLYHNFPETEEGQLTLMRSRLVCTRSLSEHAKAIDLGDYLLLGKGAETSGERQNVTVLENAFEALIGAIYLDGGFSAAATFVSEMYEHDLGSISLLDEDFKSKLQTILQRTGEANIHYSLVSESGPDHDKVFSVSVSSDGKVLGTGTGRSKKSAEQEAARQALNKV
jgi:ribonuclease-3